MTREPLPVDDVLPELLAAVRAHPAAVLQAPTGAGKTTRVPPALLDADWLAGQIIVVEPRRLAARSAARRMACERGEQVGNTIGFHVRFDRCAGRTTRVLVVTPGMLLQHMHSAPFLEHVGAVVFDEFHERSLDSDLALGFVRLLQQTIRPDLRIVAMSATLAAQQVAAYFDGCPVIVSDGRLHPVEICFEPRAWTRPLAAATAGAVQRLLKQTRGDILVFLPGWAEIRQTARELEPWARERSVAVLPLHGDLSAAEQDAAMSRLDRPKVVLATNVAETSVTVEGITGVVDTGLAREMAYDPAVGLDRLSVVPISRAAADQRAGRAGRTSPGVCIRLWSESSHRQRAEHTSPEVRRVDMAGAVLHLLVLGEVDAVRFPWVEPPPAESLARADRELRYLQAIDDNGITVEGRRLARLPVHPRLGKLLLEGSRFGHCHRVALAAALLSDRDPFRKWSTRERAPSDSDVLDRVEALELFEREGRWDSTVGELDRGAARMILRVRDQLARAVGPTTTSEPTMSADEGLLRSLTAAFPDRLCRRRNPGGRKGVMVGGRGVRLHPTSHVTRSGLFLAVDIEAGQEEGQVRQASAVELAWLPEQFLSRATEVGFDDASGRLKAWKRTRFLDLMLEEVEAQLPTDFDATTALMEAATAEPNRIIPTWDTPAGRFRTRVRCLRDWKPQLQLPAFGGDDLREMLTWLTPGCRSLQELKQADWLGAYRARLSREQLQAVDREAPERLELPSGRSFAVQYEEGKPPVLAARIQDFFGVRETPAVAGGTVPVLLHLLAPNQRPQQVTRDLASFWQNTYPLVRKELRARYPKHQWPEDPRVANS